MSTKTQRQAEAQRKALRNDISRSVSKLARYLRDKHGEPATLNEKIIPETYRLTRELCGLLDTEITQIFQEDLLKGNKRVWASFIFHFESLVDFEQIAEQADLETLKKLSPCPEHREQNA